MDGTTLLGVVTTPEGKVEITTKTGTVEAPKKMSRRCEAEQGAFERSQRHDFLHRWEGGLDAGFDLTRGNSDTTLDLFGGANFTRENYRDSAQSRGRTGRRGI
jgi:hypothetical protein